MDKMQSYLTGADLPILEQPVSDHTLSVKLNEFQHELRSSFIVDSHDLALKDGLSQAQKPQAQVQDLGWHKGIANLPPLISDVRNEDLFAMIRRFSKDVFDVRTIPEPTGAMQLDLTESWEGSHRTEKLTLNLQRVYLSVFLGLASLVKQISRLRSWRESRRTSAFCIVYFLAWLLDILVPLGLGTLAVLIGSVRVRNVLFPPAPRALVHIGTGGLQEPQAGQLSTTDTLTGAPEKSPGEAREEEAASFVENFHHVLERALGLHDTEEKEGDPLEGKVPRPVRRLLRSAKAAGSAPGHATDKPGQDLTQKPMEELMWDKANPKVVEPILTNGPHIVGEIADTWERFSNAISPTLPFSRLSVLRIQSCLAPLVLISLFVPQHVIYKSNGFAIGFGLFGDPLISRGVKFLNESYPSWKEMLAPKNNILRNIPTNSQLTLTLLRMGEAHRSPIPPIPNTYPTDSNNRPEVQINQVPLDATRGEIERAIEPQSERDDHSEAGDDQESESTHRHLSKLITFFKRNTKVIVEAKLAVDHVRAATGSDSAKDHLGVLPKKKNLIYAGPADFKARFEGKKGWLHLQPKVLQTTTVALDESRLIFTTEDTSKHDGEGQLDQTKVLVSITLSNIRRLKRAKTFVNKPAEMAADWSADTELLGSIEVDDQHEKTWRFTAIPERDALFNRLIASGPQRWENM